MVSWIVGLCLGVSLVCGIWSTALSPCLPLHQRRDTGPRLQDRVKYLSYLRTHRTISCKESCDIVLLNSPIRSKMHRYHSRRVKIFTKGTRSTRITVLPLWIFWSVAVFQIEYKKHRDHRLKDFERSCHPFRPFQLESGSSKTEFFRRARNGFLV